MLWSHLFLRHKSISVLCVQSIEPQIQAFDKHRKYNKLKQNVCKKCDTYDLHVITNGYQYPNINLYHPKIAFWILHRSQFFFACHRRWSTKSTKFNRKKITDYFFAHQRRLKSIWCSFFGQSPAAGLLSNAFNDVDRRFIWL